MLSPESTNTLPQPPGKPLVGNLPQLTQGEMYQTFRDLHNELGDIFLLDVFNRAKMVVIRHPDMLQHVMQMNNRNYVKGHSIDPVRPLIGNGLFSSEGSFWRRQRRMMQPAFHRKQIALMADTMVHEIESLLQRWEKAAEEQSDVLVQDDMMWLTMQVVTRTLFTNSMDQEETREMTQIVGELLRIITNRSERIIDLSQFLPSRDKRIFREGIKKIDTLFYQLIEERRRASTEHHDLLYMLLTAEDADTGEKMTDNQIRDEVVTMFLAGHETTAIGLSWAFTLLHQHPEVRQKLEEEVDRVLGTRQPEASDYRDLPYTNAIFKEALRTYTPIPLTSRVSLDWDEIGGYAIEPNTNVMLNYYGTHHHPEVWPEPDRFDPERFMDAEAEKARPRFAFVPFGGGPRQCIGNDFALMEGTLALAMAAQRFRLHLLPGVDLSINPIGTLRPQSRLPMRVEKRGS